MFSIRKKQKVQVAYILSDGYSTHPTPVPHNFHKPTAAVVIHRYSIAAADALKDTNSIDGVSKKIWYNPNDWYGIPQIRDILELKKWMKIVWLNIEEFDDRALLNLIEASVQYAQSYLAGKWYYLPTLLKRDFHASINTITSLMGNLGKQRKESDIRSSTIFLKAIRALFKVLTSKDAEWKSVYNIATGELEGKDKQLKVDIMKFFNNKEWFFYEKWSTQFWVDSTIAHGRARREGVDIWFNAVIDFKTLESQVLKTISQNAYDAAEATKDKNRMQIEVKTKGDMLKMALVILQSWLLKKGIEWQQKGSLFSKNTEEWEDFQNAYISNIDNSAIQAILSSIPSEKIKGNTSERQEIQITAKDPSFEIQIVLIWNTNESGWNANPYYKMKADIDEEIIMRWWYITKSRILKHIKRRIPDLIKFGQNPEEKTPENIFAHFLNIEKKLIPLYEEWYRPKNGQSPSNKHVDFFTNKDFTSRWVNVYTHTLPYKIWDETTWRFNLLNTLSSPSTP
jgi:hypothetical protein